VKSAKGENTKAAKSGKDVKSVKSRPCPDGIIVDDVNITNNFLENSSGSSSGSSDPDERILAFVEEIKCYDTSLVTNMNYLF